MSAKIFTTRGWYSFPSMSDGRNYFERPEPEKMFLKIWEIVLKGPLIFRNKTRKMRDDKNLADAVLQEAPNSEGNKKRIWWPFCMSEANKIGRIEMREERQKIPLCFFHHFLSSRVLSSFPLLRGTYFPGKNDGKGSRFPRAKLILGL